MTVLTLMHSTGHVLTDRIALGLVTVFEHVFPNRINGYYVEGSYADGSAVATSDLDLTLVLRSPLTTSAERELANHLINACKLLSAVELDITLMDAPPAAHRAAVQTWCALALWHRYPRHAAAYADRHLGAAAHACRLLAHDPCLSASAAGHVPAHLPRSHRPLLRLRRPATGSRRWHHHRDHPAI